MKTRLIFCLLALIVGCASEPTGSPSPAEPAPAAATVSNSLTVMQADTAHPIPDSAWSERAGSASTSFSLPLTAIAHPPKRKASPIGAHITVSDPSMYDSVVISYWNLVPPSYNVRFTYDSILVEGRLETMFPNDLPLNQDMRYQHLQGDTTFSLIVQKVSYTNLAFRFWGEVQQDTFSIIQGTAVLATTFPLAVSGFYEREEDEEVFGMYDYNFTLDSLVNGRLLVPDGTHDIIEFYLYVSRHKQQYGLQLSQVDHVK